MSEGFKYSPSDAYKGDFDGVHNQEFQKELRGETQTEDEPINDIEKALIRQQASETWSMLQLTSKEAPSYEDILKQIEDKYTEKGDAEFIVFKEEILNEINGLLSESAEYLLEEWLESTIQSLADIIQKSEKLKNFSTDPTIVDKAMLENLIENLRLIDSTQNKMKEISKSTFKMVKQISSNDRKSIVGSHLISMFHDRLLNDASFTSFNADDSVDQITLLLEAEESNQLSPEEFVDKNWESIQDTLGGVEAYLKQFSSNLYRFESFLHQLSYLSNLSNEITYENHNVAYDSKFKRHSAFREKVRDIMNEDDDSEEKVKAVTRAKELQEEWEKQFNKLEETGYLDWEKI